MKNDLIQSDPSVMMGKPVIGFCFGMEVRILKK